MGAPNSTSTDSRQRYDHLKSSGLSLDLTRGKPGPDQLDLSNELLAALSLDEYRKSSGVDVRNYGGLEGLPEARALFAELLEVKPEQVIVGDNSSLAMMYASVSHAMLHGVPGGSAPWIQQKPRFLCPCPGYDRHFTICEDLGIEMVPVAMKGDGPDMDAVERLAAGDERIKGMWIVPKYGNPTGVTLSSDVVRRLASMKTAAPDFRILWDNAYAVHDLFDTTDPLDNAYAASEGAGHADRLWIYASFSKVTFAGASVAAMAASRANTAWMQKHHSATTIGSDKVNQLRHVRFLKNAAGVHAHMKRHAALLRPKFELVQRTLEKDLGGKGIATWTKPRGGYFVSLDTPEGCASRVVKLAAEAGVKLTPAGSAFPSKKDPRDTNIRIAPSFPSLTELERAMEVLTVSILCAAGR